MAEKKEGFGNTSYTLGIISIVLAFFSPLAGLIIGIVGLNLSKKERSSLALRGNKLSKVGLVLSAIILVIYIILAIVAISQGESAPNFPV